VRDVHVSILKKFSVSFCLLKISLTGEIQDCLSITFETYTFFLLRGHCIQFVLGTVRKKNVTAVSFLLQMEHVKDSTTNNMFSCYFIIM
jgi:hypothetical protein